MGRPLVFQGVQSDIGPLPRLVAGPLAPQHRFQLDTRLRERIVRNQTRIGQCIEQITPIDLLDQLQQFVPLPQQVIHFFACAVVLGALLQLGFGTVEFVFALFVAAPFLQQLLQRLEQARVQSIGLTLALHEVQQAGAHHIVDVIRQ